MKGTLIYQYWSGGHDIAGKNGAHIRQRDTAPSEARCKVNIGSRYLFLLLMWLVCEILWENDEW